MGVTVIEEITILSLIGKSLVINPDIINSYTATIMLVYLKYVECLGESGAGRDIPPSE